MTTMADFRIERDVVIEAPVEVVWRTVTEPDQIAQWFANRVELNATPGGAGVFVFEDKDGNAVHTAPLVVETVEPPHRFSFRWCHPDGMVPVSGNSMLVEFTLVSEGSERTRLRVAESGLDVIAWPDEDKVRYAEEHRDGWANFTDRLAGLLAGGPQSG
jgi:uncharacterized protein YndB with AHSA1/START domain